MNGLQMLHVQPDSLKYNFTVHTKDWEPEKILWISDSSVLVERNFLRTDTTFAQRFAVLEIKHIK
jgi:hypothetical protein